MIRALLRHLGLVCLFASAALSAQTFKDPLILPTATNPVALTMADVNRDGRPDLLYVESNLNGGALHVLTGTGAGTFTRAQDVPLPAGICYYFCYINLGDINGDGVPDIVLNGTALNAQSGTVVAALIANGDGTFQPPIVSSIPVNYTVDDPGKIAIGDLNGDGAADLALPDPGNGQVYILLGDNTGHFHLGTNINNQSEPIKAILYDLNGDGHLDLITLSVLSGQVYVALGNGDGTFATGTAYSIGQLNPLFYDVDGDGHPDLIYGNYDSTTGGYDLVYAKGNPDGTFATPTALTSILMEQVLDIGNYTGAGRADLLINTPSGFAVYPRNADGTYAAPISTVGTAINRSSIGAVGDVNSDGHPDIAVAMPGGIAIFLGNGDGSFQSADLYDVGHYVNSVALAKFTSSANIDIAVEQNATFPRLLLNNGAGAFTLNADPNTTYGASAATGSLLAGDFNGDGNTDLFETGFLETPASVLYGQSAESFTTPASAANTAQLVADVNNDGRADLILANSSGITVQLGQANSTLSVLSAPPRVSTFAQAVAVGDLNNDGKPDLITGTGSGLDIYIGNGDGTFTFSNQILESSLSINGYAANAPAAIVDINGDGKPDLVFVTTWQQSIGSTLPRLVVLPGNGDGTFGAPQYFTLQQQYTSLEVADINHDGKPDLVLSNASALAVLMNNGNGTFGAELPLVAGTALGPPTVGDVNGDGYPDIIVPNLGGTTVTVLLNKTATASAKLLNAALTVSPEPSAYAQPITLALTAVSGTSPAPTGAVSFFSDSQLLGTATFAAGAAQFTYTGTLAGGSHVITAAYSGDATYAPASFTFLHTAADQTFATSITLTATPSSILATQTVRLFVQVTAANGGPTPYGTILFTDGAATIGTATLNASGAAFLDTSILAAGTHNITASFLGAQVNTLYPTAVILSPSTSTPAQVIVAALPTTTALASSSTTTTAGTVLTLTATVASPDGTPFGGVTFFDGATSLGTIALTGTQAVFSTASLAAGSHSLTAQFNANNTFAASTSSAASISVQAAQRHLAPTLTLLQTESLSNGTAQLTATVLPASAAGTVTFLADGAILGSAPVNSAGTAQFTGFAATGSIHNITAALTPSGTYAPSASPGALNGWTTTPDFSLSADTQSLTVQPGTSATLHLSATGLTQPTGTVALSCLVPEGSGYTCTTAPQLAYGASTTVTITAPSPLRIARLARTPAYLACFALALLLTPLRRRRKPTLLLLLAICASTALTGCTTLPRNTTATPAVLRIQAATPTTTRTLEVFLNPQSTLPTRQ